MECRSIHFSMAAEFYDAYEHLGDPGRGVYHWGAFNGDNLLASVSFGSACFGLHRGIFAELASEYGVRVYQLTRGGTAPYAPKHTGSWIVGKSLQKLRVLKGNSIVVAYSDPHFNEIGTIYQASNFLFLGKTDPKGQSDYKIYGEFMSGWKVRRRFGTRNLEKLRQIDPEVLRIPLRPKYRYLYLATNKHIRKQIVEDIQHLLVPYPKRNVEGIDSMNPMELVKKRERKLI